MEEVLNNSQPSGAQPGVHVEPELRRSNIEPKGVLRKNLKPLLYLGAAALVIVAAIFSTLGKKAQAHQTAADHDPPQPAVQDNTDNNVQNLKNTFAEARQRAAQQPGTSRGPGPSHGECHSGATGGCRWLQRNRRACSMWSGRELPGAAEWVWTIARGTATFTSARRGPAACGQGEGTCI